jgi:ATP-binding cassette, subfamily F, member 3
LRRRARDAEERIARLAEERARIEAQLADPSIYAPGRAEEIAAANMRLAAIVRDIQAAEAAWLEAEAELEAAG